MTPQFAKTNESKTELNRKIFKFSNVFSQMFLNLSKFSDKAIHNLNASFAQFAIYFPKCTRLSEILLPVSTSNDTLWSGQYFISIMIKHPVLLENIFDMFFVLGLKCKSIFNLLNQEYINQTVSGRYKIYKENSLQTTTLLRMDNIELEELKLIYIYSCIAQICTAV